VGDLGFQENQKNHIDLGGTRTHKSSPSESDALSIRPPDRKTSFFDTTNNIKQFSVFPVQHIVRGCVQQYFTRNTVTAT
jgi:hypothetical protein